MWKVNTAPQRSPHLPGLANGAPDGVFRAFAQGLVVAAEAPAAGGGLRAAVTKDRPAGFGVKADGIRLSAPLLHPPEDRKGVLTLPQAGFNLIPGEIGMARHAL